MTKIIDWVKANPVKSIGIVIGIIALYIILTKPGESVGENNGNGNNNGGDTTNGNNDGAFTNGQVAKPKGSVTESPTWVPTTPQDLASCLKAKGAKFYGTYWCGACNQQKALFGDSAKNLPYIECSNNNPACASILSYPTWIFPDGKKVSGMQSLSQLKAYVGC